MTPTAEEATAASHLPATSSKRGNRIDQQRFERAALALAGGRVGGDVHAADECRQGEKHRNHIEDGGGALLGAGYFDVLHIEDAGDGRADAAGDEPEPSGLGAESRKQGPQPLHFGVCGLAGGVGDDLNRRRTGGAELLGKFLGDDQDEIELAVADRGFGVRPGLA